MDSPRYFGRPFIGRARLIGQHVPPVDVGLAELPVHVPGCVLVCEAVAGAVRHLVHAPLHRGKKDDVMQMIHGCLGSKVGNKPGPENTVVHAGPVAYGLPASAHWALKGWQHVTPNPNP